MKALIVDLNNFSRYPTLSVGYLSAILKAADIEVETLSPLFFGVHGFPRRTREPAGLHMLKIANHIGATSSNPLIGKLHTFAKRLGGGTPVDDTAVIVESFNKMLKSDIDVVLVSAYTMYFSATKKIAEICAQRNTPLLVGGNMFVVPDIARTWADIPGVTAVFAGEPEKILVQLVSDISAGKSVAGCPGITTRDSIAPPAPPLQNLDDVPFPDFSAFPWECYPNRIVPIMTGRGCEWARCTFCSDVLTSAGRQYRSRSLANVLAEIRYQREKHNVDLFVFLDLKLNSDVELWRGLAREIPRIAPGIKWTASVHVDSRKDNGLSREDLQAAADAGLARITCGLESGSQAILNSMKKGVKLDRLSQFIRDAHAANLSVRLTSIIGDPEEEARDIDETTRFLNSHADEVERVVVNRFALAPNTPATNQLAATETDFISLLDLDKTSSLIPHTNKRFGEFRHIKAVYRLLRIANQINRKPLIAHAAPFEGAF
ncbi:B12-binding domain-containing radical SAM protein [Teredinibacter turnerae]|uniref:B12-binding domain-containing radical SAM protein n=1 Tax=Teredinibacter turnerae TaxID=2426 RepID=UPI00038038DF|nr:radical SAM protein [Teredinibacter turnerae]